MGWWREHPVVKGERRDGPLSARKRGEHRAGGEKAQAESAVVYK